MESALEAPGSVAFGRFRVLPHRRELLADGRPVKLGGRAFDVLMALIEARGAVVSKNALMACVWPDRIVEENNLQWQISALRAAFGADRNLIRTISGRGYQFTAEIDTVFTSPEADANPAFAAARPESRQTRRDGAIPGELPPTNLPEPISELVGRDDVLDEILSLVAAHRLVTLTGTGGIGKTRLALAAARRLLPQFADGVWLAEFSPIADPGLVPVTVAAAIGLDLGGGEVSTQRVSRALAGQRLVLVLDTCEHVIGAAAALGEAVLRAGATLRLIAASREPLRAEGEWVYHVPPLAVPAADLDYANDVLRYGAVQLFVERARAAEPHFAPDRREAALIATICRRLDGLPLAIELAAARAAALGIDELAARLDDRFRILTGGHRTALPRHQTLRATLDWSYELLSEPERVILRRLAVFAGTFRLEAASAVIAGPEIAPAEIVDGIANLVAKSLVIVTASSTVARYRLLDTMRAYALTKLTESGEVDALGRWHAEYYRELLETAAQDKAAGADWSADFVPDIDNMRAALTWAFAQEGDRSIAIALAAASAPIWLGTSLLTECNNWAGKALDLFDPLNWGTRQEMALQCALGRSLMITQGVSSSARAALTQGRQLAEDLQDVDYELRALAGLTLICIRLEDFQGALALGRRATSIAETIVDPAAISAAECLLGTAHFFRGDYADLLTYVQRGNHRASAAVRRDQIIRSGLDFSIYARCAAAHILRIQGLVDQSDQAVLNVLADEQAARHPVTLSVALLWCGCLISLVHGDMESAEGSIARLKDHAQKHGLNSYYACGLGFEGRLSAMRGDLMTGEQLLRACIAGLRESNYPLLYTPFVSVLADVLAAAGRLDDSLAAADEAVQRAERSNAFWWMPEALRIKGDVMLLLDKADTTAAEDHFRRSLDLAHRQGALSWELRTATSLAQLRRDQGRTSEARDLLASVYGRLTEGFDTADLKVVKALLDALR